VANATKAQQSRAMQDSESGKLPLAQKLINSSDGTTGAVRGHQRREGLFSPNNVALSAGYGTAGICTGGSFPSGRTTTAYEAGFTPATLLPQLAPEILAWASEQGHPYGGKSLPGGRPQIVTNRSSALSVYTQRLTSSATRGSGSTSRRP
jgi:hypothetical protein